jgi:hypothetical protein
MLTERLRNAGYIGTFEGNLETPETMSNNHNNDTFTWSAPSGVAGYIGTQPEG